MLVGEDNPYGADPEFALYPAPRGCSGHRLMQILGLPEDEYLGLHRRNLCDGAWSMRAARLRVAAIALDRAAPWRVVVMLGRKVATAFAYEDAFFTRGIEPMTAAWDRPIWLVSLPHPSGRNTIWNRPEPRERAREMLRDLAPQLSWGRA